MNDKGIEQRRAVLAAAAALGAGTTAQVAIYSGAPAEVVEMELAALGTDTIRRIDHEPGNSPDSGGPITAPRDGGVWRVQNLAQLRKAIPTTTTETAPPVARERADRIPPLLRFAEDTIIRSSRESRPDSRLVMAKTAKNYLKQCVADPQRNAAWWLSDLLPSDRQALNVAEQMSADVYTRFLANVALARMAETEAAGEELNLRFLVQAASFVTDLVDSFGSPKVRILFDRFVDLALSVAPPQSPVTMLISNVALRRAKATGAENLVDAARWTRDALHQFSHVVPEKEQGTGSLLFHVLGSLPGGGKRVSVYADLLKLMPSQFRYRQEKVLIEGAVVEAVTDAATFDRLENFAGRLERGLAHSPFQSGPALINEVVYLFEDMTVESARVDRSVIPRSEEARRELISLAYAPSMLS